jgi:ABC-type multidrug transport system permease subunit
VKRWVVYWSLQLCCYCVPLVCLVDRAAMLWVCYFVLVVVYWTSQLCCFYYVPLICLVDRAAMLCVCYCVTLGCLLDLAAMLLLLCTVGLFGG